MGLLLIDTTLAAIAVLPLFANSTGTWLQELQFWLGWFTVPVWLFWLARIWRRDQAARPVAQRSGAILCWFVPFLNLFRPYQVVSELWKNNAEAPNAESWSLVPLWWSSCLAWFCLGLWTALVTGTQAFHAFQLAASVEFGYRMSALIASATAYMIVVRLSRVGTITVLGPGRFAWPVMTLPALGILCGSVVGVTVITGSGFLEPSPEESLAELGRAYVSQDLEGFRTYFNTEAVLYNGCDSALSRESVTTWITEKTRLSPFTVNVLSSGLCLVLDKVYFPGVAERIENGMILGLVDPRYYDSPWGKQVIIAVAKASEWVRRDLATGFQSARVLKRFGRAALVRVDFGIPEKPAAPPLAVFVSMIRVRNHRQIIAIQNISILAEQASESKVTP
jgi:hypothetical protein